MQSLNKKLSKNDSEELFLGLGLSLIYAPRDQVEVEHQTKREYQELKET